MLIVRVEERDDAVVLSCGGRIVKGEESAVLCAAVHRYGQNIILDLGAVREIDAAGLGALVSLQAAGIYLRLINPTNAVREVLAVTKLDSVFEIAEFDPADTMSSSETVNVPYLGKKLCASREDAFAINRLSCPSLLRAWRLALQIRGAEPSTARKM